MMPDLIPLSALQHYLYCPRQCALIHIECLWVNNVFTARGDVFHENIDAGGQKSRNGKKVIRSLHISSERLGIWGIADVVEITREPKYHKIISILPIEYKVGKPKQHRADEVQLCAQALCLEENFGLPISEACLFYGKTKRRYPVLLDDELRRLTLSVIRQVRVLLNNCLTPAPNYTPECKTCSLIQECMPQFCQDHSHELHEKNDRAFDKALNMNSDELL
ncbi:MAG: CRISPR-associated protein Cas4 [Akkermansia sp.]